MKRSDLACTALDCSVCTDVGRCPSDYEACEDCDEILEPGEAILVETEKVYGGKRQAVTIKVCESCYNSYYQIEENECHE